MRKYTILAVLLVFVIAVTSSCRLIVKDAAVDAQTVIIEVADTTITKAEVQQSVTDVMDYQDYIYSIYGSRYDRTDKDVIAAAQETAINALIEEAVTDQKIGENGLDQFTDAELASINQTVEETYESIINSVKENFFADSELTGDALDEAVEAKIVELGYGSRETMLKQEKRSVSMEKLKALIVADVAVTDEEVQAQYASGVSSAMTTYANTLTQYATDVNSGAIIYYRPSGYRYVKNLLIKISDEDSATLQSLASQISDDQESLTAIEEAIAELPADPAEDTEDQAKSRAELLDQSNSLTAEIGDLTAQQTELTDAAYGAIQPKVDEVVAMIDAGGDFDALLAEYGEDAGMTVEPAKTTGYLVCEGLTTYLESFVNEAMALKKVGSVSVPFRSGLGIHILKYVSDLDEGEVKLSAIRDQIKAELLANKQDSMYDEILNQWIAEADAKTYTDRLKD